MTDNSWSDERVELLKKLWADGLSASQIAGELGGVTRNAVIGKVHRLGLSGRAKSPSASAPRPAVRKPAASAPRHPTAPRPASRGNTALATAPAAEARPAPKPLPQDDVVVPMSPRVTIMELRESMCRWPLGDPTTSEFRFCGASCGIGTPYCTYHARIAYQPSGDRRRERKVG